MEIWTWYFTPLPGAARSKGVRYCVNIETQSPGQWQTLWRQWWQWTPDHLWQCSLQTQSRRPDKMWSVWRIVMEECDWSIFSLLRRHPLATKYIGFLKIVTLCLLHHLDTCCASQQFKWLKGREGTETRQGLIFNDEVIIIRCKKNPARPRLTLCLIFLK